MLLMTPSLEAGFAEDIEAFLSEVVEALAKNARRAFLIGDLLAQKQLHHVRRTELPIGNAIPAKWTYLPKKSTEYGHTPPTKGGPFGLSFDHVAKEAEDYLKVYKGQLTRYGGTKINGTMISWLEEHGKTLRQDIGKTIEDGIREGWSSKTLSTHLSEVWDAERSKLDRVARTEMMRVQTHGAMNRYRAAGVETVIRVTGPNPCDECAAESGAEYPIDEVPDDHPNGACDFVPRIAIPPAEDCMLDEETIDWLLAGGLDE
jgi:hypothetical protein